MNKEEFKQKILPLGEKMYRLSYRLLNDSELSKDCVQESLVKLWEIKHKLDGVDNIQAFVFTVVRNISIDKIRRSKHIKESTKLPEQLEEINYEFSDSKFIIQKLIRNLPQQQRIIIELRDIEELSFEEIAVALDLSVNNVRVNLSIARKKIKEELTKIYNYGLTKD